MIHDVVNVMAVPKHSVGYVVTDLLSMCSGFAPKLFDRVMMNSVVDTKKSSLSMTVIPAIDYYFSFFARLRPISLQAPMPSQSPPVPMFPGSVACGAASPWFATAQPVS